MYFRNVRDKYDEAPFTKESDEPNPYYQGYLNKSDSDFLDGYDWVADEEVNSFFSNLDIFEDEIPEDIVFDKDKIDYDLLAGEEISEEDAKDASKETRLLIWLKESFLTYLEMNRNEYVTSMIDNMDEDEYNENYKKVWSKEAKEEKTASEED